MGGRKATSHGRVAAWKGQPKVSEKKRPRRLSGSGGEDTDRGYGEPEGHGMQEVLAGREDEVNAIVRTCRNVKVLGDRCLMHRSKSTGTCPTPMTHRNTHAKTAKTAKTRSP